MWVQQEPEADPSLDAIWLDGMKQTDSKLSQLVVWWLLAAGRAHYVTVLGTDENKSHDV
jgi:hypothetical protein